MLWVTQHRPHQNTHLISFKTPRGETRQNSVWIWISTSAFYLGKICPREDPGVWRLAWMDHFSNPPSEPDPSLLAELPQGSVCICCVFPLIYHQSVSLRGPPHWLCSSPWSVGPSLRHRAFYSLAHPGQGHLLLPSCLI